VSVTPQPGKAILVSGHDLADLHALLQQTQGTGVNVYTHGELLPAHAYPAFRDFDHLKGNFGGAWQLQRFDFARFPGPIVVTTNCLIEPRSTYADRLYTMNEVGWPDVKHNPAGRDFTAVIQQAQSLNGFTDKDVTKAQKMPGAKTLTVGFGRETVMSQAGNVIQAVDEGNLKRIVVIGGCDGTEGERSYFRELAQDLPDTSLILTLGCGKYRINDLQLGTVSNTQLPRILDMGQCNDSFAAASVALALADHYKTDVNGLPLSMALSWFEQKAVAVLLSLLHLGVKNIRIGPNLPAFVTPDALGVLVDKFQIKPINTKSPSDDAKAIMQGC
jgi:hydroxylamine reductase